MSSWFGALLPTMVLFLAATVAFAGLVAVLWWALFADRGVARRCPRCWHDLSGTPGLVCGECGFRALDESQLHRPRRRWRVAGLALVVLLAAAGVVRWHSDGVEPIDLLPDRVLIGLLPWSDGSDQLARETSLRLNLWNSTGFDAAERDAVLQRCLRGDGEAPPGSEAWERRYGRILESWVSTSTALTGTQTAALLDLPCRVSLLGPAPWPLDVPTRVHLDLHRWWPRGTECRVTVTPRDGSGTQVVAVRTEGRRQAMLPVPIAALPEDVRSLDVEVQVHRRLIRSNPWPLPGRPSATGPDAGTGPASATDFATDFATDWEPLGSVVLSLPVGQRTSAEQLVAASTKELDGILHAGFTGRFMRSASGIRRFGVLFDPRITDVEAFRDVAIGLRIEVLEEGVPRRVSNLWWMGGPVGQSSLGAHAWEIEHEDAAALDRAVIGDPRWTLRVTGDPKVAMRALALRRDGAPGPPRYYAGSFEVPLRLEHSDGMAQPRAWVVESGSAGQ